MYLFINYFSINAINYESNKRFFSAPADRQKAPRGSATPEPGRAPGGLMGRQSAPEGVP